MQQAKAVHFPAGISRLSRYPFWKGVLDRFLALVLVVVLSPVIALISAAIRLDSPGSPIFTQERVGKDGRKFQICKFRTMFINNDDSVYKEYVKKLVTEGTPYKVDAQGQAYYKLVDDPRVTRVGAYLRRTNLDELPQIFNVLKGEMSFIGPRPDIPFAVGLYSASHMERLRALPGITGLWQVCDRNGHSFDDMVRFDTEYINSQSLLLDCRIVLRTIRVILGRDGSYKGRKERGHD